MRGKNYPRTVVILVYEERGVVTINTQQQHTRNNGVVARGSSQDEILRRCIDQMQRALGSRILEFLDDPDIIEIMLNPDGKIWIDRMSDGQHFSGIEMLPDRALLFLNTVADSLGISFNDQKSILQGELVLNGARIQAERPPTVSKPAFNIRKQASKVFPLMDYVDKQRMTSEDREYIIQAVHSRKNILVVGSTGSGKTTLTNAILAVLTEIAASDRILILEDTKELRCEQKNQVSMRTNLDTSMTMLVRSSMRKRPDRIIIGEVRGPEALDLLKAWNTGHPGGITTIHANSSYDALARMDMLLLEAVERPMHRLIGDAVDVLVFIERTNIGPKVTEILEIDRYNTETSQYNLKWIKKNERR